MSMIERDPIMSLRLQAFSLVHKWIAYIAPGRDATNFVVDIQSFCCLLLKQASEKEVFISVLMLLGLLIVYHEEALPCINIQVWSLLEDIVRNAPENGPLMMQQNITMDSDENEIVLLARSLLDASEQQQHHPSIAKELLERKLTTVEDSKGIGLSPALTDARNSLLNVIVRLQTEEAKRDLKLQHKQKKLERIEELEIEKSLREEEKAMKIAEKVSSEKEEFSTTLKDSSIPLFSSEQTIDSTIIEKDKVIMKKSASSKWEDIDLYLQKLEKDVLLIRRQEKIEMIRNRIRLERVLDEEREVQYHRQLLELHLRQLKYDQQSSEYKKKDMERKLALLQEKQKSKEWKHQQQLEIEKRRQTEVISGSGTVLQLKKVREFTSGKSREREKAYREKSSESAIINNRNMEVISSEDTSTSAISSISSSSLSNVNTQHEEKSEELIHSISSKSSTVDFPLANAVEDHGAATIGISESSQKHIQSVQQDIWTDRDRSNKLLRRKPDKEVFSSVPSSTNTLLLKRGESKWERKQ